MQAHILKLSEIDLQDRLTVEHYISNDLELIHTLSQGKYELSALGKLATVRGGKRLPPKAPYSATGIPYVRVVDIGSYEVELDNVVYISPELHKIIKRYQLEYNDIAIVIVGATIGKVAIFKSSASPCNFNENLARITVRDGKLNPDYLLTFLQSRYGQAYISWLTGGAAQAKLSLERIQRIEIPLLPRPIQDHIAAVMQDAYAQRREKLAAAEELLGRIEAYVLEELGISSAQLQTNQRILKPISSIAGGRFDFEAVAVRQDFYFNGIEATALRQLGKHITKRITPVVDMPDEDVNYISLGNIASMTGSLAEFSPVKGYSILSSSTKFKKGDILFGRMRPYLNKVWVAEFDGVCTGEAVVLRPNLKKVDTSFLHTLLLSQITLHQVVPLQSGTSLPRVSPSDILNVQLPVPDDMKLQLEIGQEITRRRSQATQLRQEAETVVIKAKARVERLILGEETP